MTVSLDEKRLREIAYEEMMHSQAINEGLWDDVKQGALKLVDKVTQYVQKLDVAGKVRENLEQFSVMPDDLKQIVGVVKEAMRESGESIELDDTLKAAKQLGDVSNEEAGTVLAGELEGPVHAKAEKLQESGTYHAGLLDIITEMSIEHGIALRSQKSRLDEGILSVFGISLAGFGGTIMLLKGLSKLAGWLGADKTAELLEKAHHVLHHAEEKVIDWLVPDTLSFALYNVLRKRGFKAQTELKRGLNKEEYMKNLGGAKLKVEKLIYSGLLLFFAWNGIRAALHAGISLLGFAEGAATAVKGLEIGQAAIHIGDIIELTAEDIGSE